MQPDELKAIRKQLGMTQEEMGDAIGLSRVTIGLMERGQATIEKRTATAVRALGSREAGIDAVVAKAAQALADRLRTALADFHAEEVTLSRAEAALALGLIAGMAEHLAPDRPGEG